MTITNETHTASNEWAIYRDLLNDPDFNPNFLDSRGKSLLHSAVSSGILERVTIFAGHKRVDVNIKDSSGNTPLHCAVKMNKRKITSALLDNPNIKPNLLDKAGKTAFKTAMLYEYDKSLRALVPRSGVEMDFTFHDLCQMKPSVFSIVVQRAKDFVQLDEAGNTFLHLLVPKKNTLDKMRHLAIYGFDLDSQNEKGETALHLACKNGIEDGVVSYEPLLSELPSIGCNLEKIKLLVKYEASLEITDKDGLTPLAVAIKYKNFDAAKFLERESS